jgi:hypothetical protein
MHYKPLQIRLDHIAGLIQSLEYMRYPKTRQGNHTFEDDLGLGGKLVLAGDDHGKFARGIMVWMKLTFGVGFMIELMTYRDLMEDLSTSSSMHNELSGLVGVELAEQKQKDLPDKIYDRGVMVSYQTLRRMYLARRAHRHPDWQIFCDFVETLPYFEELITPSKYGG